MVGIKSPLYMESTTTHSRRCVCLVAHSYRVWYFLTFPIKLRATHRPCIFVKILRWYPAKIPKKNPAKCTNLIIIKRCGIFWQPIVSLIHVAMGSRNLGQRCHDVTTKPHDLTIYSWFFVDDHPYTGTMSSLWIWHDQKEVLFIWVRKWEPHVEPAISHAVGNLVVPPNRTLVN